MTDAPAGRGRIYPEYWVDCCRCEFHMPVGQQTYLRAAESARRIGWRQTAAGWVCPNHEAPVPTPGDPHG